MVALPLALAAALAAWPWLAAAGDDACAEGAVGSDACSSGARAVEAEEPVQLLQRAVRHAAAPAALQRKGCFLEVGNPRADQVCDPDEILDSVRAQGAEICSSFDQSGEREKLPANVLKDNECFPQVVNQSGFPNYLLFLQSRCAVELIYFGATRMNTSFYDERSEHIPTHLIIDNNPATRLTFANNEDRKVIPSLRGVPLLQFALTDTWLRLKVLAAVQSGARTDYFGFILEQLVGVLLETSQGGSGAEAMLRAYGRFARGGDVKGQLAKLNRCRRGGQAVDDGAGLPEGDSTAGLAPSGLGAAVKQLAKKMEHGAWEQWKPAVRAVADASFEFGYSGKVDVP